MTLLGSALSRGEIQELRAFCQSVEQHRVSLLSFFLDSVIAGGNVDRLRVSIPSFHGTSLQLEFVIRSKEVNKAAIEQVLRRHLTAVSVVGEIVICRFPGS